MFGCEILEASRALQQAARRRSCDISCAESCTGGLLLGSLTAIPGASDIIKQGFVTYHNLSKQTLLGVEREVLADDGAVSVRCAEQMACGVITQAKILFPKRMLLAIAVTGIAGSDDDTSASPTEKPTGLVYIAHALASAQDVTGAKSIIHIQRRDFAGNRHHVRMMSVLAALEDGKEFLDECAA